MIPLLEIPIEKLQAPKDKIPIQITYIFIEICLLGFHHIMQFDPLTRLILSPISLLYGMGVSVRNFLYRTELLRSFRFDIPIICVGNLTVGGSGKTPHTEYLIRLLRDYIRVATLSRGYGRKTRGFRLIHPNDTADKSGDEPLQFKRKFPGIMVAVAEERTMAIPQMLMIDPDLQTILLDDGFQHRSLLTGWSILLTEYEFPFMSDYLLPSGRLREWASAYKRANTLVVSKCPPDLSIADRNAFLQKLQAYSYQNVYFSYYEYFNPYHIYQPEDDLVLDGTHDVLLVCGIARPQYLDAYLRPRVRSLTMISFDDHHLFEKTDIGRIRKKFDEIDSDNKIIITTEKDTLRLDMHKPYLQQHHLPIYAIPIEVRFLFDEKEKFDNEVKDFLLNFKV